MTPEHLVLTASSVFCPSKALICSIRFAARLRNLTGLPLNGSSASLLKDLAFAREYSIEITTEEETIGDFMYEAYRLH
jgi:hypothetical protein